MRALAIDTSTETAGVALCDGALCVARTPVDRDPQASSQPSLHGERLLGLVEGIMQKAGWNKRDLELVACCIGPGSFTGVRVGVATAKGIALALALPIVGVGSLEAMAYAYLTQVAVVDPDEAVVALLDARKEEVFWAAYASNGALLAGPAHVAAKQIAEIAARVSRRKIVYVGEIAGRLALEGARIVTTTETDRPDPVMLARVAISSLTRRGPDDLDALEPAYVRPPDITLPGASS
jgi:tRNA threonylcarbamoyladenosine biosynthesis protein TsaB